MSDDLTVGRIEFSPDFKSGHTPLSSDQIKRLLDEKKIEFVPLSSHMGNLLKELAPIEPPIANEENKIEPEDHEIIRLVPGPLNLGVEVAFDYVNWKGERSERRAVFNGLAWGSNEWHPTPQLLVEGYDIDKKAPRTFAAKDITNLRRI